SRARSRSPPPAPTGRRSRPETKRGSPLRRAALVCCPGSALGGGPLDVEVDGAVLDAGHLDVDVVVLLVGGHGAGHRLALLGGEVAGAGDVLGRRLELTLELLGDLV